MSPGARSGIRLLSVGLVATWASVASAQSVDDAETALTTGRYDDAIEAFDRLVGRQPTARAARGLVEALAAVGRYDEAVARGRRYIEAHRDGRHVWNTVGEVLARQGNDDSAGRAFRRAASGASDSTVARLNLGLLAYRHGAVDSAFAVFHSFIDLYNRTAALSSAELTAVATAVRYLGVTDGQLYKDALRAYDEAIAADANNLSARVLVGELFLEKYQGGDAQSAFEGVLSINPNHPEALLGLARTMRFNADPRAGELVRRSLEVNPNLVAARAFRAKLLLEIENYEGAAEAAQRALEVNPVSAEALAVLAAVRYLERDQEEFVSVLRRALRYNPKNAALFVTLAEVSARNRLYREATEFARRAVELDSLAWRGFAVLGINQLRIGAMDEGRTHLETAFAGDPYDVWTKNTLDLLDVLADYRIERAGPFRLVLAADEADLLSIYMGDLAQEALDHLSARYGYRPEGPLRIEVYPRHADFSVRTVGLVGLGALGVSFGPVVAMDSPSAFDVGEFNWGSTLWHELAHTIHLGITDHRVPRWVTEGLAVHEERRARKGWGQDVTPGFLVALREDRLAPVSELNRGFMRPDYPEQVVHSYYQASLVFAYLEERHGFGSILTMLSGYAGGRSTEEVFREVFGVDLERFDGRFDAYLRARFADPLAALPETEGVGGPGRQRRGGRERLEVARERPDDFFAQRAAGEWLVEQGRGEEALPYLERAKTLFPQYAGPGSPYALLARVYERQGAFGRAARELEALTAMNETDYAARVALADLRERLGDRAGVARALEETLYISPWAAEVHERLAEQYEALEAWSEAARERRAVVALDPVDRAEALYQLARVQFRGGAVAEARRTVVAALELAPGYEAAQELLLDIHAALERRERDE